MAEQSADLIFEPRADRGGVYVSWSEYQQLVNALADRIAVAGAPSHLVGILNGGWVVAQSLADHFPACVTGGIQSAASPAGPTVSLILSGDGSRRLAGADVLLVDEVVDTGRSAAFFAAHIAAQGAARVRVATLIADVAASPQADFAARTLSRLPNLVFPWRVRRDLPSYLDALLAAGPLTLAGFLCQAEKDGHPLPEALVSRALAGLAERGVLFLDSAGCWRMERL